MRAGRPKPALILTEEERERLQLLAHRARSQALLARRARVVLACGDGLDRWPSNALRVERTGDCPEVRFWEIGRSTLLKGHGHFGSDVPQLSDMTHYRYVWSAAGLQAETSDGGLVCANVFGLYRDLQSLAMMGSARSLPISYMALVGRYRYQV